MRSSLLILVFLSGSVLTKVIDYCAECASPLLKTKWYATGLPNYPDGLDFNDNCLMAGSKHTSSTTCSGDKCFELSFPLDGSQQIVRGCWKNFVQGYSELVNPGERCEYSISTTNNSTRISLGASGTFTTNPVTVMRTCELGPTMDRICNEKFAANIGDPGTLDGADRESILDGCGLVPVVEAPSGKECYSCTKFGQDGKCHRKSKSTCRSGAYCMKMDGKLGKNQVVLRSCVPINPYADSAGTGRDVCFPIDGKFQVGSMFGIGAEYSFDKKSYMCICKTDRCNPARAQSVLLAGILALLTSMPFLL